MPKLSIITVNLNNAGGLEKTIESIVKQSFNDLEYIIIDGGSIDESVEVINKNENCITFWLSEPDKGIYNAMNKGIEQAKGEYCLFLNSGDYLANDNVLDDVFKKDCSDDILYGNIKIVKSGEIIGIATTSNNITLRTLYYEGNLHHQAAFIKRDLFLKYGNYMERYIISSDYEFWIRTIILNNCSTKYLDMFISYFDMGGYTGNSTCQEICKNEQAEILNNKFPRRVLEDYEEFIRLKSDLRFFNWIQSKNYLFRPIQLVHSIALLTFRLKKRINKILSN